MQAPANQRAPEMDAAAYAAHIYGQIQTTVEHVEKVVTKYCELLEKTVSTYLETATTREVKDVVMKFFKAIPETLMVIGLALRGKLAFASAVCWAVRTVINLMPLFKALLTTNSEEISKGAKEAWANIVKQHKNFIPALAIFFLFLSMGTLDLLSFEALAETAILSTLTASLVAHLIEPAPRQERAAGEDFAPAQTDALLPTDAVVSAGAGVAASADA